MLRVRPDNGGENHASIGYDILASFGGEGRGGGRLRQAYRAHVQRSLSSLTEVPRSKYTRIYTI